MGWNKRIFSKGERRSAIATQSEAKYRYKYLQVGEVVDVDPARYKVKLEWKPGGGSPAWIPIPFPYVGPSGCLGQIPERGSFAICGYHSTGLNHAFPFILTFLPRALLAGIDHSDVKDLPDALPNEDDNIIHFRFRDLAEGDMILKSSLGAMLLANKSIQLSDYLGDSIVLRYSDQSIVSTAVSNYVFADGASVSMGPAIRNSMTLYDANGLKLQGINGSLRSFPDGDRIYIVPYGAPIEYDTKYYSEYRIDADELCDAVLDSNDVNSTAASSDRDPVVTFALGNYIGADPTNSKHYGAILRPSLFANAKDRVGAFSLVPCVQNKGQDEVTSLGLAFALNFLKSGSFIGVDKQGQLFINLSASSSNPQGNGKSMTTLATGGLKEVWGADSADSNAWDLTTKGGIKWEVGAHNSTNRSRSIDIRTSNSIFVEVNGEDEDGYGKQERIYANAKQIIGGNSVREVSGEDKLIVAGLKTEKIMGSAVSQYMADKSENVAWGSTEVVSKEKQCRFGTRSVSVIKGSDELEITLGFRKELVRSGGHTTEVTAGILSDTVKTGVRSSTVNTGSYTVSVDSGAVTVKTSAGTVTVSGTSVTVSGTASITVSAPVVNLGAGPTRSGVVTGAGSSPSHFDFVTGSPLRGSLTVSAGV